MRSVSRLAVSIRVGYAERVYFNRTVVSGRPRMVLGWERNAQQTTCSPSAGDSGLIMTYSSSTLSFAFR